MFTDHQRNSIRAIKLLLEAADLEINERGQFVSVAVTPPDPKFYPGDVVVAQEGDGRLTYLRGADDRSWRSERGAHPPQDERLWSMIQAGQARLVMRDGEPVG